MAQDYKQWRRNAIDECGQIILDDCGQPINDADCYNEEPFPIYDQDSGTDDDIGFYVSDGDDSQGFDSAGQIKTLDCHVSF
mmetsp:Transcript_22471/g.27706  ORF Transcript_22471/g.27706 Transcript_22471/m.27706 type:complete len:81 (+) Transcript_22471:961-1203(+)